MHEESAFLDRLREDPLDGLTRSVYADWLEENRDPRAEYLRKEIEAASLAADHPRWPEVAGWLRDRALVHAPEWVVAACPRYDVWLCGYDGPRKISVIKVVRELTGLGLADAKNFSETLPRVALAGVVFQAALAAAGMLKHAGRAGPELLSALASWFGARPGVSIWPSEGVGMWQEAWPTVLLPRFPYRTSVGDALPGLEEQLRRKAREMFGAEVDAMQDFENDFPARMNRRFRTPEQAREFLRPFEGLARMEVRHAPLPPDERQVPLGLWQGQGPLVRPSGVISGAGARPVRPRMFGRPTREEVSRRVLDTEPEFLQYLLDDPLDHDLRARYIAWLQRRDPRRAEYLLRQSHLALHPPEDARHQEAATWLDRHEADQDADWVATCCPRFEVWLRGYHASRKIPVIRAIRELTEMGLADSKAAAESLPTRVYHGAVYPAARRIARMLQEVGSHDEPGHWIGELPATELRPCTECPPDGWPGTWPAAWPPQFRV